MEQSRVGKGIPGGKRRKEEDKDLSPHAAVPSQAHWRGQPADRPAGRVSSLADRGPELQTKLCLT